MITNTGFNPCGKLLPISLWKATKNIVSIMSRNIMTIYNNLSFRFWTRQQDSNLHIFQRELTFGSYTWDSVALPFELYRGKGLITDNSRLRFSRYLRGMTLSAYIRTVSMVTGHNSVINPRLMPFKLSAPITITLQPEQGGVPLIKHRHYFSPISN